MRDMKIDMLRRQMKKRVELGQEIIKSKEYSLIVIWINFLIFNKVKKTFLLDA